MPVEEGKFQLYTSITPALEAGDWRLVASQELEAETSTGPLTKNDLEVDSANVHFRVKSPRYLMPPDQVLSTYPPANSFGSYGSRLPQVVIKRRTLPWERRLNGQPRQTPWLALVLIAEGEARLETGVDVADCVTPGVTLEGIADVQKGNCLVVRKSVIDKVFPTRNDVPLLAHAREVDISDTELMMGDDDGFLAVVISNRLPVPGKDETGAEAPVKYLACLVNLEGQFEALLERSPDPAPVFVTEFLLTESTYVATATRDDHNKMGTAAAPGRIRFNGIELDAGAAAPAPRALPATGSKAVSTVSGVAATSAATANASPSQWSRGTSTAISSSEIAVEMARDFRVSVLDTDFTIDPEYRFPVLLHWCFTTTGSKTFRSLMEGLDSRLLGDVTGSPSELTGRLPLEVVESGHVGLGHKTRDGDDVRSWYRGPLLPHPTDMSDSNRLPLAHSSDQLRIVIQDGREDLSLAAAFEVGRLLALSQPSIVASLMRWRQDKYLVARLESLLEANRPFWEEVLGNNLVFDDINTLGPLAGRFLVDAIAANPEKFLGTPRAKVTPGRPLDVDGRPTEVLATGLGLPSDVLEGDIDSIFEKVRGVEVPVADLVLRDVGKINVREGLESVLDTVRIDLVSDALATQFVNDPLTGPAFPVISEAVGIEAVGGVAPDALDEMLREIDESGTDSTTDDETE